MSLIDNINTAIWWTGAIVWFVLAMLPVICIAATPRDTFDDEPHGDTTGYERIGKDWRP